MGYQSHLVVDSLVVAELVEDKDVVEEIEEEVELEDDLIWNLPSDVTLHSLESRLRSQTDR